MLLKDCLVLQKLLEYPESSCELDTWQERLGHERATTPGIGRKILLLAVHGKLIYKSILQYFAERVRDLRATQ